MDVVMGEAVMVVIMGIALGFGPSQHERSADSQLGIANGGVPGRVEWPILVSSA